MDQKLVLGIDTSAKTCTAAVYSDRVLSSFQLTNGPTHSQSLLPAIKDVLSQAKASIRDLSAIAVSVGPGSFTGLRIGIAAVKGLAIADGLPCAAVSTLEALAVNADRFENALICPVMDARRGEYYNALFSIKSGILTRICEDRAIPGKMIAEQIQRFENVLVLGDGAEKFVLENQLPQNLLAPDEIRFQSGESVAKIGAKMLRENQLLFCHELAPRYLRLPQAEREWLEKNKTK